ncbi:hypothetical protein MASR2M17_24900 [Aminivibrio sp.]
MLMSESQTRELPADIILGQNVVIEDDVEIASNVEIGHNVVIRSRASARVKFSTGPYWASCLPRPPS